MCEWGECEWVEDVSGGVSVMYVGGGDVSPVNMQIYIPARKPEMGRIWHVMAQIFHICF